MFVRCTVYEIGFFFSFCHFGVDQPFCYVVFEHLYNVDEGASYLTLFCYRPVSLVDPIRIEGGGGINSYPSILHWIKQIYILCCTQIECNCKLRPPFASDKI